MFSIYYIVFFFVLIYRKITLLVTTNQISDKSMIDQSMHIDYRPHDTGCSLDAMIHTLVENSTFSTQGRGTKL